jgi:hypothetical protein
MNRFTLLLLPLLAACVFAQDGVTRGDAVRRREFQTYATTAYFVDPAGSDTNACLASGAANACLTVQGVIDKLPKIIRNTITITVAAGSYAGFIMGDRLWSPGGAVVTPSGSVAITGSKSAVTPTTGSATGTLTTVSATTTSGTALLIDSGQAWTVDDAALDGAFIRMTSGTANGQVRTIVTNGGTTLSVFPSYSTNPSIGDTYIIEKPAVIFTTGTTIRAIPGGFNMTMTDLEFQSATSSSAILSQGSDVTIRFGGVRAYNTSTGTAVSVPGFSATGSSGPLVAKAASTALLVTKSFSPTTGVYARSTAGTAATLVVGTNPSSQAGSWLNLYARIDAANRVAVTFQPTQTTSSGSGIAALYARCGSTTGTTGLVQIGPGGQTTLNAFSDGCATGFAIGESANSFDVVGAQFRVSTLSCTLATTCVQVTKGARARIPVPTLSSVTNAYSVDGVTYSEAQFSALSPVRIVGPNLSILER